MSDITTLINIFGVCIVIGFFGGLLQKAVRKGD